MHLKLAKCLAAFLWLKVFTAALAQVPQEALMFGNGGEGSGVQTLELSSIESNQFTTFSHPAFPGRSARIKKSDFCDGGVASYTGYIDIGSKHLFFYFFESRNDPDNDDVILWTNGGPGGSSALGLFIEHGPCTIASANSTKYNPYSWNSNANMFFIDQPVGVGFSYHDLGDVPSTSEEAGLDIAAFVAMFFETFTKFKGRNFHLTGESYAGRYLPIYAATIYDQNSLLVAKGLEPVNLKSVMIGNGATDFFSLLYSYYDMQCTNAGIAPVQPISTCIRMKQVIPRCEKRQREACIEHFDLIDCKAIFDFCFQELVMPYVNAGYNYYDMSQKCDTEANCYPQRLDIVEYLGSSAVREKIGADATKNFTESSSDVLAHFWAAGDQLHETQQYLVELLSRGVKVLIYAGSYDFIGNWLGNERWVLRMEWDGQEAFARVPLTEWSVDGVPAGKTRAYKNLSFTTIYGAGHLAPHDKPLESLVMLQRWLADEPF